MVVSNSNDLNRAMAPIDRSGITELVVQRIKELLESGALKAGSRLPPERELAEMLSISRPSLRTALKALSVMGIINAKPGAGTFIADSLPEVFTEPMHFMALIHNIDPQEMFEARRIIETGLAELAAERASAEDLKAITEQLDGMKRTIGNTDQFLEHDIRFHQAIARASGNKVMSGVMDTVAQMLYEMRRQVVKRTSDFEEAIAWHERIYDAIRRHDPKRAKEAMAGHLQAAELTWSRETKAKANYNSKRSSRKRSR
jgi:GntR family transcriptional repressor for pyruvate dehydrogenase complex